MKPQRNIELPSVGNGGLSNDQFEHFNFESGQNYEQSPERNLNTEKSREAVFSAFDNFSVQGENLQVQQPAQVLPAPMQNDASQVVVNQSPATAQDIDLMEDEWVKDLKKMISETKNDPYTREIRFKQMQVDYLKKRYNRIIGGVK
ncbi:MAG: hypothetical protein WAV68_03795 [Candidatus Nanogingivalis sp.]